MSTAIVIVAYNAADRLKACLGSIYINYTTTRVVVVDNNSTENIENVCFDFPNVSYLKNTENLGFAKACNQGAEFVKDKVDKVLFLNPDTVINSNSILALETALDNNPGYWAVGPLSNFAAGWQNLGLHYPAGRLNFDNVMSSSEDLANKLTQIYNNDLKKSKLLIGFALMISIKRFYDLGCMDEDLILGMDDLDLSWRIQQAGGSLAVVKESFIWHKGQESFITLPKPEESRLRELSQINFTKKLLKFYGDIAKVPSPWDLWEIDWFHLHDEEISRFREVKHSENIQDEEGHAVNILEDQRDNVILFDKNSENGIVSMPDKNFEDLAVVVLGNTKASLTIQVRNLLDWGVKEENLLVIGASPDDVSNLPNSISCWNLSPLSPWQTLYKRINSWFPMQSLLIQQWNSTLSKFTLSQMLDRKDCAWVISEKSPNSSWVPEADRPLKNLDFESLFLPLGSSDNSVASAWKYNEDEDAKGLRDEDDDKGVVDPELHRIVMQWSVGLKTPMAWIKEKLIEIRTGQEGDPSQADGILFRIDPLSIRGLSERIKHLFHPNLDKIGVIIDNGFYQESIDDLKARNSTTLHNMKGVSPYDVQREITWAGWVIDSIDGVGLPEKDTYSQYGPLAIRSDCRSLEENYFSLSKRLVFSAYPAQKDYNLDLKVSIVILALNKIEYTSKCIESIQAYTKQSVELILVDNGSTDTTLEYFNSVPGAIVIRNEENLGVAAGWNQGMEKATGDYTLVLNNDTLIGPNTIENMVRCAINNPKAGMIAPRSNAIAGPQMVHDFGGDFPDVFSRIEDIQKANDLSSWTFPRIKGFCMLLPKQAILDVGYFDEQFGFGNFEDDDYSLRLKLSGYELIVADDSFVFHYGSVSFDQAGIDWNAQMTKNHKLFNQKWSKGRASFTPLAKELPNVPKELEKAFGLAVSSSDDNSQVSNTLKDMLKKASQLEFESDTANTDYQDNLLNSPTEVQDFWKSARQLIDQTKNEEAFKQYCLALEMNAELTDQTDDSSKELALEVLNFLKGNWPETEVSAVISYLANKFELIDKHSKLSTVSSKNWKEEFEQLVQNGDVESAQRLLYGLNSESKKGLNFLNCQGTLHFYRQELNDSWELFNQALNLDPVHLDTLLNIYDVGVSQGRFKEVIDILERALKLNPELEEVRRHWEELKNNGNKNLDDPNFFISWREENLNIEKLVKEGMLDKALDSANSLIEQAPDNARALNNKALILWYSGDVKSAWPIFIKAIEKNPLYTDALINLYDCAVVIGELEIFKPLLSKGLELSPENAELLEISKHIEAGSIPDRLKGYFRDSREKKEISERLKVVEDLVNAEDYGSAVQKALQIVDDNPECAEAYNHMGICAWHWNRLEEAFAMFHKSIELDSHNSDTLLNLWDVALKVGRTTEVRPLLENALLVDSSLIEIKEILYGDNNDF